MLDASFLAVAWQRIRCATVYYSAFLDRRVSFAAMHRGSVGVNGVIMGVIRFLFNEEELNGFLSMLIFPWSLSPQQMGLG